MRVVQIARFICHLLGIEVSDSPYEYGKRSGNGTSKGTLNYY